MQQNKRQGMAKREPEVMYLVGCDSRSRLDRSLERGSVQDRVKRNLYLDIYI